MLYKYACRDMGLNCFFMVTGATVEEVTEKALAHVLEKHSNDFNNIQSPTEIEHMKLALSQSTKVVIG